MFTHSSDDLEGAFDNSNRNTKPFWKIDYTDTTTVLQWLNTELSYQKDRWMEDFWEMRQNVSRYEGLFYNEPDQRARRNYGNMSKLGPFSRRYNKISVNHLRDFTEARVSKLIQTDPNFLVMPDGNEYQDDVDARVAEKVAKAIWHQNEVRKTHLPNALRIADVCGESYLFTDWNPFKGPQHPAAKNLQPGETIQVGSNGESITAAQIRMGDVDYKTVLPYHTYIHDVREWKNVDWIMPFERQSVETLKFLYPNYEGDLKPDAFSYDFFEEQDYRNRGNQDDCTVFTFYHRNTVTLTEGRKITFTQNAILENIPFPFKSEDYPGPLPCTRFVADVIPGKLRGVSLYRHLKPLQDHYNTLTSMAVRNQILAAHPKWMMPYGACKTENLGNDVTIVQYKGPVPPQLVSFNPTPPEVFQFRTQIKEDMQQLALVFGQTRGEPPQGITAAVALQFLNEQENGRYVLNVERFQRDIVDLVEKTILVVGNKYEDSDERIIRSVGGNTGFDLEIVKFKASQLAKKFNVKIQNSSSLPESKAARTQNILDMAERYPDKFPAETVISMVGLSSGESFVDSATIAVRSAQSENEFLLSADLENLSDDDQYAPQVYEDHIIHWKQHVARLQEQKFKHLPKEIQARLINHIMATEMLMIDQASESAAYGQALSGLVGFPIFFKVPPPAAPTPLPGQLDPNAMVDAAPAEMTAPDGPVPDQPAI